MKNYNPSISEAGVAKVLAVKNIAGDTGEPAAERYAGGFVAGGVVGAVIVGNAEKDIGRAELFSYTLQLADGSDLTVHSFSAVAVNDCVKILTVSTKTEMVLERLDDAKLCEAKKPN